MTTRPRRDDVQAAASARLAAAGQRMTPSRRNLVEVLAEAGRPMAMPQILAGSQSLALSSAYRNLAALEEAGVVRRVAGTDELVRFELAEELTEHHHHFVCTSCGAVTDVSASLGFEREVRRAAARAAQRVGYRLQGHRLDMLGLCPTCA